MFELKGINENRDYLLTNSGDMYATRPLAYNEILF